MSSNNINTLCRIDQAIRGLNDDGTDDSYVPAQSTNGALERIEKSIKELDIKGIKSGLPKVTNADNGKVLQVKNGKWGKGDIDTPVELITGDIDYNNNVTLSHSGQEVFAMMSDGKLPIIFLEHDSLYGKTYEVYNYTTWYIDSNQEKIFEFTRIMRYEGRTVFWTVPINTVSASNVFKAKSESISNGPARVCLYQATDYEHAKLWSSDNWNNASTWITLADGHTIDEFDEIQIVSVTSEGDQPGVHRYDNLVTYIVNAEDLDPQVGANDGVKARIFWQSRQTGQQRDCDLTFSQDLTKVHPASAPAWYVIIYAIYGIKY